MQHAPGSDSPATDAAAPPGPQLELVREVQAGAAEMRAARAQLRAQLDQWQLGSRLANAVLDVAHELVVNGHQHGAAPVRLTVTLDVTEVRVEVHDASQQPARLLPYRPGLSEHGLGLQLVRQLSLRWGQTMDEAGGPDSSGKSVWAVFPRPATTFS